MCSYSPTTTSRTRFHRAQHEECARSAWCERCACEAEVCGGFYYLRASAPAIAMLEALFERMAWQRQTSTAYRRAARFELRAATQLAAGPLLGAAA